MKKNAAAAAMVAQVVLMRGFRVWESWGLGLWRVWCCGVEEDEALMDDCDDEDGGVFKESEEMGRENDGRW
jgi:hypothetical protein